MWLLDDSLKLSNQQIFLPYALARVVSMMDGTHSIRQLHKMLSLEAGEQLPRSILDDALRQLDDNLLLDNVKSQMAVAEIKRTWQEQPFRPIAFAGHGFPAHANDLEPFLDHYSHDDEALRDWPDWHGRALISPHIDYQRGGPVYAKVWQRARAAINDADLILIFGTDHRGGPASLTLSSIPYATPYGILPTDSHIVTELANTIGHHNAFELELNHRNEHAIELAATWLHHIRRESCPVVPILVGSFHHFTPDGHPSDDPNITNFISKLRELTAGKKVFSVASVDLSHVGPVFDNDYLMDDARREALAASDGKLMHAITLGEHETFYKQLATTRNENNVCGFSPTWLMMEYLGDTRATSIAYDQCPADPENTSTVSICGMLIQ